MKFKYRQSGQMKNLKLSTSMTEGPLFINIIRYSIPIMLTGVLQLAFNAADLVIVGRFCGSICVGAVGSTSSLVNLIINLFIGLSTGAGVTVAHALGSHNDESVHKTVHTAIPLALISGFILTIVGVLFSETFLRMMNVSSEYLPLSTTYLKIYFSGITFTMLYNFSASILRAAGDTKSPLFLLSAAGVINVILNIIFVKVFDMNVAGVALATTISQAISAILMIVALIRRTDSCRLILSKLKITDRELFKILRIGIPSGIQGSLFSISNVTIQSSVNLFGADFVSGCSAATSIEGFVYTVLNSFYHTALNFSGQNTGAKNYKRVRKVMFTCLACSTVAGITFGGTVFAFGRQLLSIYITDSQQAISYGIIKLMFVCLPYFLCGIMEVVSGTLRGMGVSISTMIISIFCVCGLRIAWVYTIFQIPRFHTGEVLFASYPISWIMSFAIQLILFFFIYRKRTKRAE